MQWSPTIEPGESLSQFVENAVRTTVAKRKNQAEFIRRGMAAIDKTKRDGSGIPAEVVIAKLEAKLAAATIRHQREDDYH